MGCGVQKGHMESYYRGVEVEVELIPKVRVEVVISEVPLQSVIEVTKKVLKTGNVGDGKIFVYDVDNVIRIGVWFFVRRTAGALLLVIEMEEDHMRLTPRETDKLMLHYAGTVAKGRLERGILLSYPEAIAYISMNLLELAREGKSVSQLMQAGKQMLRSEQVMDGVAEMIHEIQLEVTFPDGTKLVTVHNPIQ